MLRPAEPRGFPTSRRVNDPPKGAAKMSHRDLFSRHQATDPSQTNAIPAQTDMAREDKRIASSLCMNAIV